MFSVRCQRHVLGNELIITPFIMHNSSVTVWCYQRSAIQAYDEETAATPRSEMENLCL